MYMHFGTRIRLSWGLPGMGTLGELCGVCGRELTVLTGCIVSLGILITLRLRRKGFWTMRLWLIRLVV